MSTHLLVAPIIAGSGNPCLPGKLHVKLYHARRRKSAKRGGDALQVPLDEELLHAEAGGIEVVALDRALDALATIDGRKSRLVELRYFGGLSVEEASEVLGVSKETAKRDWEMARAWLYAELAGEQKPIKTKGFTSPAAPF